MTCPHEKTSTLSSGPPLFTPALHDDGRPILFCLDCHAASDQPEWLSQPAATPYPEALPVDHALMGNITFVLDRYPHIASWPPHRYRRLVEALAEVTTPLLAEAERRGAERGWDEGRESVGRDMMRRIQANGFREATPNPYRKPSSAVLGAQESVEVAGEGPDTEGGACDHGGRTTRKWTDPSNNCPLCGVELPL